MMSDKFTIIRIFPRSLCLTGRQLGKRRSQVTQALLKILPSVFNLKEGVSILLLRYASKAVLKESSIIPVKFSNMMQPKDPEEQR